ncbi:hypothetical protein BB559_003378 [Furculomyces boomerangus]|uniref:Pre-mRNA-splicing factor SLU7 n=2 Tax=Harpellales TaxID=61421 RepID=A0A2T9YLP5_9FUNG|nr:hypothetical protein BB559_003378 [Furculomyces boomerangus]PWA00437.1 hypothetical protein BB558_003533 [Smittium angustum]
MHSGNREDYRKQKDLEAARKAGNIPAEVDEEGREINPHIPQFMSQAPWYVDSKKPSLKHQRDFKEKKQIDPNNWYARGVRKETAATKYRKGACENCGAMSHKTKECMERPRKKGAKWTGKDIMPDEVITHVEFDFDKKRDRWNGYDPKQHLELIQEWEIIEEARKKKKAEDLDKAIASGTTEDLEKHLGSSDEESGDEDKYAEKTDMPGQKLDLKSRTTIRNLRIREDTAKYLRNLDPDSAYYDPKSRSMRENPYQGKDPNELPYAGDNFVKDTGESHQIGQMQLLAWEAERRGNSNIHLQANPTESYGGTEHLVKPEVASLAQDEHYVEYSRYGKPLKGVEKAVKKSRYPEDVYIHNHTGVWGSYWKSGKWGYSCCHQTVKNSYCIPSLKK